MYDNNGNVIQLSKEQSKQAMMRVYSFADGYDLVTGENFNLCFPTLENKPKAPTLPIIDEAFGKNTSLEWLEMQLVYLNLMAGTKTKMEPYQFDHTANILRNKFSQYNHLLNVREIMIFFFKVMSGDFGTFYGAIDPMKIGEWADAFLVFRKRHIEYLDDKIEERNRRHQREEMIRTAATPEQRDEIIRRNLHSGNRDMLAALNDANHWGLTLPPPDNSKRIAELTKSIENSKIHLRCMTEQAALASTDETRDRFNDAADKVRTKIASLEAELKQLSNGG